MNLFLRTVRCMTLLALLCLVAGCKTTDMANDGSLASTLITGHTETEIQQATIAVFQANGFDQLADLTFEKQGSQRDTVMFGGLDSERVWIKIRVHVSPRGKDRYVLGCDAYAVQNHGDRFIETESRFKFSKGEECLDLLEQIRQQLSRPGPETR